MSEEKAIVRYAETAGTLQALQPNAVLDQIEMIQNLMAMAMQDGEHYGTIPGCGTKKILFKSGAEKLGFMFRLEPDYQVFENDLGNFHKEYRVTCTLHHIESGNKVGQGVGSCSTLESKYRWREQKRKCPKCGNEFIIKGKDEYGGGWLCWAKKGGCNAKFKDGDESIESQKIGRVENEDIADQYNTVLKMAKKRAHVDAILTATAASDIFTQDMEDFQKEVPTKEKKKRPPLLQKLTDAVQKNKAGLEKTDGGKQYLADARKIVGLNKELSEQGLADWLSAIDEHLKGGV